MTNFDFCVWHSLMICLLWGALFQCVSIADQGGCRRLKFVPPVDGKRLESHIFLNLSIGIYTPCEHRCVMESGCVSVNIGPSMENDKITCELNDADHLQFPDDLRDRPGWTYRGTENPCSGRNPCFHNGTCVSGYSDKRFICLCPDGYTGEQCEQDIDECKEGSHDCHKDATCINTAGHFNCTCNPGHTGDGRLCSDINECDSGQHNCSLNAVCYNTKGSYICNCLPGYYRDERNCTQFNVSVSSCREIYQKNISNESKAYPLIVDNKVINVYCHMTMQTTGNGACGEGGWTLIMKIDGSKSTFHYDSSLWRNKENFNLGGGETGFDTQETKLPTYWNTSFTKICLGMKVGQQINFIVLYKQASSLYSLIADGQFRNTSLGRKTWKTLIGSEASLQFYCNREGFNAIGDNSIFSKARIGILGDNNNNCGSTYSRIGFGCGGGPFISNTCGNAAGERPKNAKRSITTIGYILVQ